MNGSTIGGPPRVLAALLALLPAALLAPLLAAASAGADDRVLPTTRVDFPVRPPARAAADARTFHVRDGQIRGRWLAWLELTTDNPSTRAIRYTITARRTRVDSGVVDALVLAERSTRRATIRLARDGTLLAETNLEIWILPPRGSRIRVTIPPHARVCRLDRHHLLLRSTDPKRPGLISHRIGRDGRLAAPRRIPSPRGDWRRRREDSRIDPHPGYWVSTDGRFAIHKGSGDASPLAPEAVTVDGIHGNWLFARSRGEASDAWLIRVPKGERLRLPAPDRLLLFTPAGVITHGPAGACLRDPVTGRRAHFVLGRGERVGFDPVAGRLVVASRRPGFRDAPAFRTLDPAAAPVRMKDARARAEAMRHLDALRRVHLRAREEKPGRGTLGGLYDLRWPYPPRMQRTLLEILQADPDVNARRRAAVAVGFQDQPGAARALLGALEDRRRFYFVRQGILEGLGYVGRRGDSAAIRGSALDRGTIGAASRTLAILGDPESRPILAEYRKRLASGRDRAERRRAVDDALELLTDRPRVDAILARLARRPSPGKDD